MAQQEYVTSLIRARDSAAQILADVLSERKPSYSVAGVSFSWSEYASSLTKQIEDLNRLIAQGNQPFWTVSRARP